MDSRPSAALSIQPLRWMYTVATGFALTTAVRTLVIHDTDQVRLPFDSRLLIFVVFMSFVIRFAHGALRAFDLTYTNDNLPDGFRPLIDFVGLFTEAVLFILMALSLNDHSQFAVYLLALVVADLVWLALIRLRGPCAVPFRNWVVSDTIFVLVWVNAFVWHREEAVWLPLSLFGVTVVHTLLDYVLDQNWEFYFATKPPLLIGWIQRRLLPPIMRSPSNDGAATSTLPEPLSPKNAA